MISVLYVDDEPDLLELAKLFLELSKEFSVTTVESAHDGLALFATKPFDLILSDYQMPDMDGLAFLKEVRLRFRDIPFILFTGRGREEVVIEAINNDVDFYLQKGGDPNAQFAELAHKIKIAVERRKAVSALKDSEQRLSDLINFLPDATFAIDTNRTVISWNKAIEELTGIPSSDMLGKGNCEYALPFYNERHPFLVDLILGSDATLCQNDYAMIKKEGSALTGETLPVMKQGIPKIFFCKASLLYNKQGEIVGAIESLRDITAQKQAEEELQASYEQIAAGERQLRAQYNELKRNKEEIEAANSEFKAYEQVLMQNYTELIKKEQELQSAYEKIAADDKKLQARYDELKHSQDEIQAAYSQLMANEQVLFQNYTELTNKEQKLQETESRFRTLTDTIEAAIFIFRQKIVYANPAAESLTAYSMDELAAMDFWEFIHPDFREIVRDRGLAMQRGEDVPHHHEFRIVRKDGDERWVAASSSRSLTEEPPTIVSVCVDITDRKLAEEGR